MALNRKTLFAVTQAKSRKQQAVKSNTKRQRDGCRGKVHLHNDNAISNKRRTHVNE